MEYAKSLSGLLEDKDMGKILDRSENADTVYEKLKSEWTKELFDRNPTSAYNKDGNYKGSNLDMVSLLNTLVEREAIINLPEYTRRRARKENKNEWIVSENNRHGKLVGIYANKEAFSFSVRIIDQNVVDLEKNETGKFRNYMVTDLDGNYYNGSSKIEMPNYEDIADFAAEHDLMANEVDLPENKRAFGKNSKVLSIENFIQPNLWQAFYSGRYFMGKALEERYEDECDYYRGEAKKIKEKLPRTRMGRRFDYKGTAHPLGKKKEKTVEKYSETLEAEIDIPEFAGKYPAVEESWDGVRMAEKRAKKITYKLLPSLRFNTRAIEFAFYKHGDDGKKNPGWPVPEIERDYKLPKKKNKWNRIAVNDELAIRYRILKRKQHVTVESELI